MMTVINLQAIANAGGSIVVSAANYSVLNLQAIANACKVKSANLTVRDADKLSVINCQAIASANPGHVIFDFT